MQESLLVTEGSAEPNESSFQPQHKIEKTGMERNLGLVFEYSDVIWCQVSTRIHEI